MKKLLIVLTVRCGEYEFTERVLHETDLNDIVEAGNNYAKSFYDGLTWVDDKDYYFNGGEVAVRVRNVKQLTKSEFNFLKELFSDGGNYLY